jgi:hypothetical protein
MKFLNKSQQFNKIIGSPAKRAMLAGKKEGGLGVVPTKNFCPPASFEWWVGVRRQRRRTSQSEFCSK